MLKEYTTIKVWFTLTGVALFALLPILFASTQPVAEAAKVKEKTATTSWTKCTGTTCIDTVIIGTHRGRTKTLSFEETTYHKNTGKVMNRRGGFAKNVNCRQDGLKSASVDARVPVERCNAQDVCKKAGSVHVKASWTGTGKTWVDRELGKRLRDAKVTGSVDGKKFGNVNFATLTEDIK
jgi:hypothetical protein